MEVLRSCLGGTSPTSPVFCLRSATAWGLRLGGKNKGTTAFVGIDSSRPARTRGVTVRALSELPGASFRTGRGPLAVSVEYAFEPC